MTAPQVRPPLPDAVEAARLRAVARYAPDAPDAADRTSPRLDDLARTAAEVCAAPLALVTLVDGREVRFRARVGIDISSGPREVSFCTHAVRRPGELTVVPDASADPRFADGPLVLGAGIRSYAGAPVVTRDGLAVGTVCVLDTRPREFSDVQLRTLRVLAAAAMAELELDRRPDLPPAAPGGDDLRAALDRGELEVHLQPLWSVQARGRALSARLTGAEALVRWRHPDRGLLLPGSFLPEVEQHGLGTELGTCVLATALATLAGWDRSGLLADDFCLHVNVAAGQLHEGGVPALLEDLAGRTGADLGRLVLEVTESALLDPRSFSAEDARDLTDLGVRFALDDFGTGFASLAQLRAFPFSSVKVDRSFVAGLGTDRQDEVIVESVVSMATRLGIAPVCEGVETPEQLERVLELGCSSVQGFLLGRPAPPAHWEQELLGAPDQVLLRRRPPLSRAAVPGVLSSRPVLGLSPCG